MHGTNVSGTQIDAMDSQIDTLAYELDALLVGYSKNYMNRSASLLSSSS